MAGEHSQSIMCLPELLMDAITKGDTAKPPVGAAALAALRLSASGITMEDKDQEHSGLYCNHQARVASQGGKNGLL